MKITYVTTTRKALGVSRITVHSWASNKRRPSVEHAEKLEALYGIPMASFLNAGRSEVWQYIKSLPSNALSVKLTSFANKHNINTV